MREDQGSVTVGNASLARMREEGTAILQQIRTAAAKPDPIPAGFLTVKQWSAIWGMSDKRAWVIVCQGIEAGIMERRNLRTLTGGGLRPIPYYGKPAR